MKNKIRMKIATYRIGTKMASITIAMFMMLGFVASIGVIAEDVGVSVELTIRDTIYITDNSEFTLINGVSNGTGTVEDPYIIENWEINGSAYGYGIVLQDTNASCVIRNCELYEAKDSPHSSGIVLYNTSNVEIYDCVVENNDIGIFCDEGTHHVLIRDNYFTLNGKFSTPPEFTGVYIDRSTHITVDNNIFYDEVTRGMYLHESSNCVITNNTFDKFGFSAIFVNTHSHNTTIKHNYISNASNCGIHINYYSNNCIVLYNKVYSNNIGISLSHVEHCIVAYNDIYGNSCQNANESHFKDIYNNEWFLNNIGNYWGDYTGMDTDGDGIGETPYDIINSDSQKINSDLYPLTEPYSEENTYASWGDTIIMMLIAILPFIIILLIFQNIHKSFAKGMKK